MAGSSARRPAGRRSARRRAARSTRCRRRWRGRRWPAAAAALPALRNVERCAWLAAPAPQRVETCAWRSGGQWGIQGDLLLRLHPLCSVLCPLEDAGLFCELGGELVLIGRLPFGKKKVPEGSARARLQPPPKLFLQIRLTSGQPLPSCNPLSSLSLLAAASFDASLPSSLFLRPAREAYSITVDRDRLLQRCWRSGDWPRTAQQS